MAARHSLHTIGGMLPKKLLNADTGGPLKIHRVDCRSEREAEFVGSRCKGVTTVLSRINIRQTYYRCPECGEGVIPVTVKPPA